MSRLMKKKKNNRQLRKSKKFKKKSKMKDGTNTDEFIFGAWGPSSVT